MISGGDDRGLPDGAKESAFVSVNQKGLSSDTPRIRSFTYDALSRLLCSSNPETTNASTGQGTCPTSATGTVPSGVISYKYDADGNLTSKTDGRDITTSYVYDTVSRVLSKTYSNDPTATASSCFQYDTSAVSSSGANLAGRLTNEWTQKGACPSAPSLTSATTLARRSMLSYDPMGRLLSEQQCTVANCSTGAPYNPVYDYDLVGNVIHHSNGIGTLKFTNCYNGASQLLLVVGVSLSNCSSSYAANAALFSSPSYTPAGSLSTAIYGTGLSVTRTYDSRLRVAGETDTGNAVSNPTPGTAMITITGTNKTQ